MADLVGGQGVSVGAVEEQVPRVLVSEDRGVAVLRLNRPEARNAIDDLLQEDLIREFERVAASDEIRALILTGAGPAFCAGGDVKAMQARLQVETQNSAVAGWRRLRGTRRMVTALNDLGIITIAAVNGPAVGVGFDLALACDFVVASESAFFACSFIQRGLVPDGGGLYFLPRRVGLARTKDLVITGRRVVAQEALDLGIIDHVVPGDRLEERAISLANEYCHGSRTAIALSKSILNRSFESTREQIFELSAVAQGLCYSTAEHDESVREFLKKQDPDSPSV